MKQARGTTLAIHVTLCCFAAFTLLPFAFLVNNVFRTNTEFYHNFFSFPDALEGLAQVCGRYVTFNTDELQVQDAETGKTRLVSRSDALRHYQAAAMRGPRMAWRVLRPYMLNSFVVSLLTALGVAALGSSAGYVLARYRFWGSKTLFVMFLSTMMFPAVLTLVPSFLLVKKLQLLNTYGAMVLPYIAGGQVFAIFVFRSFFMGLPEDLFESARIDGAGHVALYWHLIVPLCKPVFAVVIIMNVLGTWNNFLWPFIVNTDGSRHVIASGLFTMASTQYGQNFCTMYAAYAISSIPLLILFVYATKPFIRGVTAGGLKA